MMRSVKLAGMALALALVSPAAADPVPPLNCYAARLPAELEICRQGYLMALDQQVVGAYFALREGLGELDQRALDASQQRWRDDRNRCGAQIPCIRALYGRRFDELRNWR